MLAPDDRRKFIEALSPPTGMQVDFAIGTTYSLDLVALTTIPLAMTGREFLTDDALTTDRLALLHGIRNLAGRILIFCNAGQIKVPARQQPLFGYLESCVHEVMAPHEAGVFHPKLWVVRYTGSDSTIYRVICSSRNLTFDRSWDVLLVLEGKLTDRKRSFGRNAPLCDFISCLPQLTVRNQVPAEAGERIRQVSEELRIIAFENPDESQLEGFHPLGIKGYSKSPFRGLRDRILIVSPFLSGEPIRNFLQECEGCIIVSRSDELDRMSEELLAQCGDKYVLNNLVERVPGNSGYERAADNGGTGNDDSLQGLHAKIYVSDDGWNSRLWIGSANATKAALSQNVEFLIELSGKRSLIGIDAILAGTKESMGLQKILLDYQRAVVAPDDADWRKTFDETVLLLRRTMSHTDLKATVCQDEEGYRLGLELQFKDVEKLKPPSVIEWSCWPITCDASRKQMLRLTEPKESLDFGCFAPDMLTEFFAFQLFIMIDDRSADCSFVLRAPLNFSRAKRNEALLRRIIQNENDLLRYLMLSAAGEDCSVESGVRRESDMMPPVGGGAAVGDALFETLVSCLVKEPERLQEFEKLMSEMRENAEKEGAVSPRFAALWSVIAEASRSMRGKYDQVPS